MYKIVLLALALCNATMCMQSNNTPTKVIEACYLAIFNNLENEQVQVYVEENEDNNKYRHKSLNFSDEITSHFQNTTQKTKRLEIVKGMAEWRVIIHKYSENNKPPKMINISSLYKQ